MGELRESLLKQQLQHELDTARKLEADGKSKQATTHYKVAASIYRRLAYISPRNEAESLFHSADQFEGVSGAGKAKSEQPIDKMIVYEKPTTKWEDIGGLKEAKREVRESIILPMIVGKPAFVEVPRTILLYGPPGTGKTLLAKAASNTLKANFFEAKTSTLLSKYYGESEKIIGALFDKARKNQPSLIFMDEFDSIMITREAGVHEATRRVISQLLVEIDGFSTKKDEKVIIMAATNRPWDLDDAMISRFQRKIYVPLPDVDSRRKIFEIHVKGSSLSGITADGLAEISEGYSGRDIASICREAIMFMIREQNPNLEDMTATQVEKYAIKYRPLTKDDFTYALSKIKKTVSQKLIKRYDDWKENLSV
ncbi:MAG: ATP-binding protein [Candidatus Aenigmarchaeota archaeon]|nr:ATP-binding protein [Candidatus Aenigmarchaeota archaeon]